MKNKTIVTPFNVIERYLKERDSSAVLSQSYHIVRMSDSGSVWFLLNVYTQCLDTLIEINLFLVIFPKIVISPKIKPFWTNMHSEIKTLSKY